MRFARLGSFGDEVPVVIEDDRVLDLRPLTPDLDGAFFASGGIARAADAVERGILPELPSGGRIGAPIGRPSAVYCVGMNYAAHAAESGSTPPENLVLFLKAPNTVVGPDDDVAIPPGSVKLDWEVELGIVIGSRASYLDSPENSREHIAGFVLANDLSERDWQLSVSGGQWSKGKCGPGFLPIGPWLVTPDEIDADDVRLRSWVNGEPRQDSRTSDLIFAIDTVVWELSQFLVLEPGDLILTGTPEGVGLSERFPYISHGDVVEVEIDGLGRQRQTYVGSDRRGTNHG
ncbi:fumarylacetoacetate hydrolase family protein [Microbacterium proteolyticum]|uniref:fumarylacetoacetate hydrolase family protein n=1 Tax=Microbacterium proteolyticum TaxID=1572644 RepID=UPI001FAC68C7|nr:fumarylacetoacetate hydrolase family protein [Microbacterium proteolyticum]MCI9857034.1 fumarylacetoacetate hydrolase family protein [Microbacterium proteolyticum]